MVKIGIVQMQSAPLHLDENLSRAERLVSQAAGDGAELVVLPEMFSVGFSFSEELMGLAETLPEGETVRWLQERCREHGISMITSLYERHEGHFYNTMVAVDPEGALQRYRKRNPTWF